jgi:hypothetical protein
MMQNANESENENEIRGQSKISHVFGGEIESESWSKTVIGNGCLSWIVIDSWSANRNVGIGH